MSCEMKRKLRDVFALREERKAAPSEQGIDRETAR